VSEELGFFALVVGVVGGLLGIVAGFAETIDKALGTDGSRVVTVIAKHASASTGAEPELWGLVARDQEGTRATYAVPRAQFEGTNVGDSLTVNFRVGRFTRREYR
jgi:hypothetical protein